MEKLNLVLGISNTVCSLLVAGLAIPLIKEKVKMNRFYGVRFSKAFESNELWYKINKKGGTLLLLWSALLFAIGLFCFFLPERGRAMSLLFACAPLVYLVAALQVYAYTRKL